MSVAARLWNRDPAWIAVLASLVLSFIAVMTDDVINSDGILYVEVATKVLQGDWAAANALYKWPFYSYLIAAFSVITSLGLETSAHLINALLLSLLAYAFVRCSEELGGEHRVAMFAVILLITSIPVNDYRDLIVRDFGYWAFFFTAILFFLRYINTNEKKQAMGFVASMIIATLFRIEGIVFVLMMPLLLLFQQGGMKERFIKFSIILSPIVIISMLVGVYIVINSPQDVGRLFDGLYHLEKALNNITSGIAHKGDLIVQYVIGNNNRSMGTESILAILIMIFVMKILKTTGIVSVLFSILTLRSEEQCKKINGLSVILGVIAINVLVLAVFLLSKSFLSSRYVITLSLLITLLASFALSAFFSGELKQTILKKTVWQKRAKIFLVVVFIYTLLDGITSFSPSKSYMRESGVWLKNNMIASERLFANEASLRYYAGRSSDRRNTHDFSLKTLRGRLPGAYILEEMNYTFVAIKIGRKQSGFDKKVIEWAGSQPVHQTGNERGDKVLIFKLK